MCGILGAYGPAAPALEAKFPTALNKLAHRGPDGEGQYRSPNGQCLLGHRRLSILDLSDNAAQPMRLEGSALVYNGEIYNHLSLRPKDVSFRSHGDSETLLHLLSRQGDSVLSSLKGMFAGAFYDERKDRLLLFRDSLGIKPLYWSELADGTIVFASEIRPLLELGACPRRNISAEALAFYLRFENYPQGMSLFEGIHLLKPGEIVYLQNSRKTFGRFGADSERGPVEGSPTYEQIYQALENAVSSHLLSDVPLGVYLSGGIDSSLIATLAKRKTEKLRAFTGYFSTTPFYDERPLSATLAKNLGIELEQVQITPHDFETHFDDVMDSLEEPRMGMGSFSGAMVARRASRSRKVILAGHGGDELFAGYPLYQAVWALENSWRIPSLKQLPWFVYAAKSYWRRGVVPFAPEIFQKSSEGSIFFSQKKTQLLSQLENYYQTVYLPGLLLVEDRLSMAHSLETRVPLWSSDLISLVRRLKPDQKMPSGRLKGLLKQVVGDLLPSSILQAPKRGFPTPLRLWFRKELLSYIQARLCVPSFLDEIVSLKERKKLIQSHRCISLPFALDERRAHRIWVLLCLESWTRKFQMRSL